MLYEKNSVDHRLALAYQDFLDRHDQLPDEIAESVRTAKRLSPDANATVGLDDLADWVDLRVQAPLAESWSLMQLSQGSLSGPEQILASALGARGFIEVLRLDRRLQLDVRPVQLPRLLRVGATLHVQNVQQLDRSVARIADAISYGCNGWPVRANLYVALQGAPPASTIHHDPSHLFALQLSGSKDWFFWPENRQSPSWLGSIESHRTTMRPEMGATSVCLREGMLLHLTAGIPHFAVPATDSGSACAHLTFMPFIPTTADVHDRMLRSTPGFWNESALSAPSGREPGPVGDSALAQAWDSLREDSSARYPILFDAGAIHATIRDHRTWLHRRLDGSGPRPLVVTDDTISMYGATVAHPGRLFVDLALASPNGTKVADVIERLEQAGCGPGDAINLIRSMVSLGALDFSPERSDSSFGDV